MLNLLFFFEICVMWGFKVWLPLRLQRDCFKIHKKCMLLFLLLCRVRTINVLFLFVENLSINFYQFILHVLCRILLFKMFKFLKYLTVYVDRARIHALNWNNDEERLWQNSPKSKCIKYNSWEKLLYRLFVERHKYYINFIHNFALIF